MGCHLGLEEEAQKARHQPRSHMTCPKTWRQEFIHHEGQSKSRANCDPLPPGRHTHYTLPTSLLLYPNSSIGWSFNRHQSQWRSSTTNSSRTTISTRTGSDGCVCTSIKPAANLDAALLVFPRPLLSLLVPLTASDLSSDALRSNTTAASALVEASP